MRSIPKFMRGVFRGAMKVGLQEITKGRGGEQYSGGESGMEIVHASPRLLLSKPSRGGLIPKGRLKERVTKFCAGEWIPLLEASMEDALVGRSAQAKRRRCQKDTVERRAAGALGLAQLGSSQVHVKRVLLFYPASQWSEVPTTVVATSREVDTAHQSPPSTAVASTATGEVARVLGQDVPSTVVASQNDVVSESNHGEGSGVRGHRRLALVQREVESDTDSVRSEPSEMTSVGGISERGEGVDVIDPTPEAPPLAFIPRGNAACGRFCQFGRSHVAGCVRHQSICDAFSPLFLERSVQRSNQGGPPRYPQKVRTPV